MDAILIQLSSQRPSDVWRGKEQVRQWLKEDPEDRDVYALLVNAAQKNRNLRDDVRNIFVEMLQNGSKAAEQAILSLPSGIDGILADADDAYYAAEYDRAIQLYQQVLRLNPENPRAKDHLQKAMSNQTSGESSSGLPRPAEQYYRRARSLIAARDVLTAMNLLEQAIETAKGKGMNFPEAEEEMQHMQNLLLANEYLEKAKTALANNQRREAIDYYEKASKLDSTNTTTQHLIEEQRSRLKNEVMIRWAGVVAAGLIIGFLALSLATRRPPLAPPPSATAAPTIQLMTSTTVSNTDIPLASATPLPVDTIEVAVTNSVTSMPTQTPTPVPPTEIIVGVGFINKAVASAWEEPNRGLIERLTSNHPLTLLEQRIVGQDTWYKCRWESDDGVPREGWILGEYITFGATPMPPS
jgi:tetratricopeptide (TPR) repeat protein